MPRRRQGFNLTHVLIAVLINQQVVREQVLAKVFGRRVYAYLHKLRRNGVVIIGGGIVSVNSSFNELVRMYVREIERQKRMLLGMKNEHGLNQLGD